MTVESDYRQLQARFKTLQRQFLYLRDENEELNRMLDAFIEGARNVLKGRGFEKAARSLFELCKAQTRAKSGYVALLNEDGSENEVLFLDAGGVPCSVDPELPMPIRGLRAQAYESGQPVIENDFEHSQWQRYMPEGHARLKNVLFVPIVHDGRTVGLLGLANKPSGFTDKDARIAAAFGKLAAISLREAKRVDEINRREAERDDTIKKFFSLFHAMKEGVCIHEVVYDEKGAASDYRVLDVNPAYETLTMLKKEEAVNRLASDLYGTGEAPFLEKYTRVAETGMPETFEIFWPPMQKHFLVSVVSPKQGQFATVFTDISDQKQKEALLRLSEEYLSTTLNSIGDAVITTDVNARVMRMNPVAESLTGWRLTDARGRQLDGVFNIFNERTREKVESPVTKVLREGGTVALANHTVMIAKDGSERFIDDSGAPIRDQDGKVIGVVLIFRDITEKYKADAALRKSEKKYRQLFEKTVDAIFVVDRRTGRILDANSAAEDLVCQAYSDLYRTSVRQLFGEAADQPWPESAGSDRTVEWGDTEYLRPDGTKRFVRLRTVPLDEHAIFIIAQDVTEQRRAESALRENEFKLRSIFQAAPIGIGVVSERIIQSVNEKLCDITGYSQEELIGISARILYPDDAAYESVGRDKYRQIRAVGTGSVETVFRRKDGRLIYVLLSSTPFDLSNQAAGVTFTVLDITDRKYSEKALAQSKEWYRLLFNSGNDAIFIHPLASDASPGTFLQVNEAACLRLGYSREELLAMSPLDISADENGKSTRNLWARLLEERTATFETVLLTKNGGKIPVEISARKFFQEGCPMVISTARDIGTRLAKRAEYERLITAIEQTGEIIAITDTDGTIQYVNPAFERITGYSRREAVGENPRILRSGRHDRSFYEKLWETVLGGNQWTGRLVNTRKDGSQYISQCAVTPVKDKNGTILSFVWIARDITREVEFETRLAQAQKMEAIGALAGGIAHDFNNILFPILGMSEMLMEDLAPGSNEHESITEINTAAKRAGDLVNQILSFSRQVEHRKLPIRIQGVLKEAVKLARSTIPSNIEISLSAPERCGLVNADPTQMHQIAMNLITNAYHAVEESGGKISVVLQQQEVSAEELGGMSLPPGPYAVMSVSDTGRGIPAEVKDKIFEPYFTTKAKGKGTGLGLSVVYGIVKDHKGDIRVRSDVGEGTAFHIYLPLLEKEVSRSRLVEKRLSYETGSEHILLVDDDEAVGRLVKQMLERLGYHVTVHTGSPEALRTFRADPDKFDLVITDMTMPNMTGDRLTQELIAVRPEIPIIICTGFSERMNRERAEATGAKGFLMKPVAMSDISGMIRKILDEK